MNKYSVTYYKTINDERILKEEVFEAENILTLLSEITLTSGSLTYMELISIVSIILISEEIT